MLLVLPTTTRSAFIQTGYVVEPRMAECEDADTNTDTDACPPLVCQTRRRWKPGHKTPCCTCNPLSMFSSPSSSASSSNDHHLPFISRPILALRPHTALSYSRAFLNAGGHIIFFLALNERVIYPDDPKEGGKGGRCQEIQSRPVAMPDRRGMDGESPAASDRESGQAASAGKEGKEGIGERIAGGEMSYRSVCDWPGPAREVRGWEML